MSRLATRFATLKKEGRAAFVPFITAGDPDMETSFAILEKLPGAGADIIELGMPFSDPMADGPAVQASSMRALKAGASMTRTLDMLRKFRKADSKTPVVLSLVRILAEAGKKPQVLSRGYGGSLAGPLRVDPKLHDARRVGDEALLLAAHAPTWVARCGSSCSAFSASR